MKIKSKLFNVSIKSLGLKLPEFQPKINDNNTAECFIPACLDVPYKIKITNKSDVKMAFSIKIDGRSLTIKNNAHTVFVSPKSVRHVHGFDGGAKIEDGKYVNYIREFVFSRPQVGAANNNGGGAVSTGTIEITAHPTHFLREEVRKMESRVVQSPAEVPTGRILNERTMKQFTDGEKVATKAGEVKVSDSYSVSETNETKFDIWHVGNEKLFVVTFKYRDLFSLLQKNIIPVETLKEYMAKSNKHSMIYKDRYDYSETLRVIKETSAGQGSRMLQNANRRLFRDLKELRMNPLPTLSASPLDDNLLLWHANLHGTVGTPFEGLTFHLELLFNEEYPFVPPRVKMLSFLAHSNVIHGFICLDMLGSGDFVGDQAKPYTGWTSAYSLLSVLLQLQAFLFDRANMTEAAITAAKFHQKRFTCSCGHCHVRPWPTHSNEQPLPESEREFNAHDPASVPQKETNTKEKSTTVNARNNRPVKTNVRTLIKRPSYWMKRIRCNPSAILSVIGLAALPGLYKYAHNVTMDDINTVLSKSMENLSQKANDMQFQLPKIPAMPSITFSVTSDMILILKVFGAMICVGLIQYVFIKFGEKNRNRQIRDQQVKINRAQAELTQKRKAEKETRMKKQMEKALINRSKNFVPIYTGNYSTDEMFKNLMRNYKPQPLNYNYIEYEDEESAEYFDSPATVKYAKKSEARINAALTKRLYEESKNKNNNTKNMNMNRRFGPIKKSKFARNSNTIDRAKEVTKLSNGSKNRYQIHDEESEISFMEKQLLMMNHSVLDVMRQKSKNSSAVNESQRKNKGKDLDLFSVMPNEILLEIFSFINHTELMSVARVSTLFRSLAFDGFLWDRRELVCFHSKVTFEEDILGIGINVQYYPESNRLSAITSPLDLLSYEAYRRDSVRTSVWKTSFKFFMPLYINRMHGQKAMPFVNDCLSEILQRPFEPNMAIEVFPKLMNTMVVELMDRKLHASMKALEGYCFFHRLFIEYTVRYTEVLEQVETTIGNFIENRRCRNKKSVPNLGEFLTLLTVSQKYDWHDIADVYIEEQLVRNVKWVIEKSPIWHKDFKKLPKDNIIQQFLHSTQVSQRLLIFNYYFVKDVAKPKISHGYVNYIKQNYDLHYGKPSLNIRNEFHNVVKYIQQLDISQWHVFFHHLGLGSPSNGTMYAWIVQAKKISALRKYHQETIDE